MFDTLKYPFMNLAETHVLLMFGTLHLGQVYAVGRRPADF